MPDEQGRPVLYLDTNVLLDTLDQRRQAATDLLERIGAHGWRAITCPFGFLEIIEAKKADRWAETLLSSKLSFWQVHRKIGERRTGKSALPSTELTAVYTDTYARLSPLLKAVIFPDMPSPLLKRAEDICASTNIDAADSLHLATALHFGCDILVTSDADLLKMCRPYINATTPEGIENALKAYERQQGAS